MCDVVKKLIRLLEPYTLNIQKNKEILDEKTNFKGSLDHFKTYIDGEKLRIFDYEDEEIIKALLLKQESNYDEYNACKYILMSPVEDMKKLPQYIYADNYIKNFLDYTIIYSEYIDNEYDKLNRNYEKSLLMQKYYNILDSENVFIENIGELLEILDNFILTIDEKIDIVQYINIENNKLYVNEPKINDEYNLLEFEKIIEDNKKLFENKYQELLDIVDDYVDINSNIKDIVNDNLVNKIDIRNIILAKKIWLIKRIDTNYEIKRYDKVNNLVNEFMALEDILKRIENITDKIEIIKVIKGEY